MTLAPKRRPDRLKKGSTTYTRGNDGSYRSPGGDLLDGDDLFDALASAGSRERSGGVEVSSEVGDFLGDFGGGD